MVNGFMPHELRIHLFVRFTWKVVTVVISTDSMFAAFITVKSLSISSGVLSPCCTHTDIQSSLMIPPPAVCYVLWQTKGCLILLSLSIVTLSVLSPPPPHSISPASQTIENPSLFVNWPGSGERIAAKCSAACLSLTFRLFCSAFHQRHKIKTQPRQIKPIFSQSACLSHRDTVVSQPLWSIWMARITGMFVCIFIVLFQIQSSHWICST